MDYIDNTILRLLYEHRYIFAFLGALFEGFYIMLLSGVLLKFGYFNIWALFAVLFSGYLLHGISWYLVGRAGGYKVLEKWGKRWKLTRKIIDKLEHYFKRHSVKTIFITTVTYGVSALSFVIAGSLKMKWKKFLSVIFIATIIWVMITVGLGFVFGLGYDAMGRVMKTIATGLTVLIFAIITLAIIVVIYFIMRALKKKLFNVVEKEESSILEKTGAMLNHLFKDEKD